MRLALIVLCGCNSIFGIESTRPEHVFFDAMPDAPFGCPASGPPAFSNAFTQVVSGGSCSGYTTSRATQTAAARCTFDFTHLVPAVVQGPADSDQVVQIELTPAATTPLIEPKLSPDGDELWLAEPNSAATGYDIVYYKPGPADNGRPQWIDPTLVWSLPDGSSFVGTPTRAGASRRVMVLDSVNVVHELAEANGAWTDTPLMQKSKIETFLATSAPNLTPDGLHMVFAGALSRSTVEQGIIYAARASLDVPFTFDDMTILAGPPDQGTTPFLTEDCSRVYFSGLASVFYVTELLN